MHLEPLFRNLFSACLFLACPPTWLMLGLPSSSRSGPGGPQDLKQEEQPEQALELAEQGG